MAKSKAKKRKQSVSASSASTNTGASANTSASDSKLTLDMDAIPTLDPESNGEVEVSEQDADAEYGRVTDFGEERGTLEPRRDVADISAFVPRMSASDDDDEVDVDDAETPAIRAPVGDVDAELRAVEAEVDRIFFEQARKPRRGDDDRPRSMVERLREAIPVELPGEDGNLVDAAKDVLSTDYYLRQWGRIGMRDRSEEVDEFGLDPVYEARLRPVLDMLYKHYFRVEVTGIENVPASGRCILVANHSGVLPYDGIVVRTALRREHSGQRDLRWLAEDFIFHLPFLGAFMNRIGAVRACQENAERLLRKESAVLVFPEGIKGIGKLYDQRYQLQRFGRGGFIKLALRTQSPIIPVSIVGAEESAPMLYRIEVLTQALGLPFVPVTPTFPLLGPLGLVPAPTKWKIEFGAPMQLEEHGAEAAEDALLVNRLSERVRTTIQKTLDRSVKERKSVWFG